MRTRRRRGAIHRSFGPSGEWDDTLALYAGLRGWLSPQLGGDQNGYASEAYDAALDSLREAASLEEHQAALEEVQVVVNEEVPFQVFGADVGTTMARENIKGITWQRGIDPLFEYAYLEE